MSPEPAPPYRSGFAAILGKPNAGKSTLLNAVVGLKVAIVSGKPQTTRDRIAGIVSEPGYQIVFLDTPGVIEPRDALHESLMRRVAEALDGADVLLHLVDVLDPEPFTDAILRHLATAPHTPRLLVCNKGDLAPAGFVPPAPPSAAGPYQGAHTISALRGDGVAQVLADVTALLPEGPPYYDPEQLTDRDERFLASEIVREKVFELTQAEVPYSVLAEVETFEERPGKDYVRIVIHVERDSQKGILIGQGGAMLKQIGQEARRDLEELTGRPAYLELWVKVRKNWTRNPADLERFGFRTGRAKRKGRLGGK